MAQLEAIQSDRSHPYKGVPALHAHVVISEVGVPAELVGEPLLPRAGDEYKHNAGPAGVMVLGDGSEPVVEGTAPQRQALAHHPEAAPVVPGDHPVEPAPALELHPGFQSVHAVGKGCGQAVHRGHGVHTAQQQSQPLPGHRVGPHELRRGVGALAGEVVRWLEGRWAVPWLTFRAMPSCIKAVRAR